MAREIRTYSSDEKLVQERREHIRKCAIKVFSEKGYAATTMRELALACGVAQGAIYHYIGAKDDILRLICAKASSGGQLLRDFVDNLGAVSATEALVATMREYYQWADADQENYLFFSREINSFSPEDREMLLRSQVDIIQVFEGLLEKGTQNGEFMAKHPTLTAHNIVTQGYEWAVRRWYLHPRFTLKEFTDAELELLFSQLGIVDKKVSDCPWEPD